MKRYLLILLMALIGLNIQAQEEKVQRHIIGEFIRPEYTSRSQGVVIVEILIEKDGKVIEAHAGALGTTTTDKSLWISAEAAAMKTRFNAVESETAQWSTISYQFGNTFASEDLATIDIPEKKIELSQETNSSGAKLVQKVTSDPLKIQRSFYDMSFGDPIDRHIIAHHFNISESAVSIKEQTDHKITYQIANANRTFAMRTWETVMIESYDGLFYSIIFRNDYRYSDSDLQENNYNTIKDIFNQKYNSITDWPGCCDDYYIKKTVWKDKTSLIELDFYRSGRDSYITLTYKSSSMEENLIQNVFDEI